MNISHPMAQIPTNNPQKRNGASAELNERLLLEIEQLIVTINSSATQTGQSDIDTLRALIGAIDNYQKPVRTSDNPNVAILASRDTIQEQDFIDQFVTIKKKYIF